MEKYKLILNEENFDNFINWLPELGKDEWYQISIMSRKKYDSELIQTNDQNQLLRAVVKKDMIKKRIKEFEREVGTLFYKKYPISQQSLVCYINPNPRCMQKANKLLLRQLIELVDASGFNIVKEAKDACQKAKSKSNFVHFEVDEKNIDLDLTHCLSIGDYTWIETRGGYHLLVNTANLQGNKLWYQSVVNQFKGLIDKTGDMYTPIPGTYQGGFEVKMI